MHRFLVLMPLLSVVSSAGCKDNTDIKIRRSGSETFAQVAPTDVDILWIVDDSVSMEQEQAKVQAGSADFVDTLDGTDVANALKRERLGHLSHCIALALPVEPQWGRKSTARANG